jgi:thiol-disulfide isomerase/thioredoxin/uncharacterized membrane protein YphA (DoxX/SURF4 family)
MKRTILADIISFFFIFLFLYTGALKLTEINTFKQQLSSSPLMSSLAGITAWALPIGEILLAVFLFIPKTRLKALYATAGLMTLFTGYVIILFFIDDQLSCSCGGIISELTPRQHIFFNSACVILAVIGILALRRQQPTRQFAWLTGSSAIALFALVAWFVISAFRAPVVEKTGLEGRLIPSIPLQLADSTSWLKTDDIPGGKPFIVMGFSPWCIHCQALTVDIKQHMNDFKNVSIYYITPDRFKNMRTFYRFYKLADYPNITMGRDSANTFFHFFNSNKTPLIAIFDAKKRLKRVIPGQPKAADLAKSLQD